MAFLHRMTKIYLGTSGFKKCIELASKSECANFIRKLEFGSPLILMTGTITVFILLGESTHI